MKRDANSILQAHVIERIRRQSVSSQDMEAAMGETPRADSMPRMGEEEWLRSLALVRRDPETGEGIEPRLWAILEVYYAGWDEDGQRRQSRAAEGSSRYWPMGMGEHVISVGESEVSVLAQTAVGLTYQEACVRVGVGPRDGRKWWRDALEVIGERLTARGER